MVLFAGDDFGMGQWQSRHCLLQFEAAQQDITIGCVLIQHNLNCPQKLVEEEDYAYLVGFLNEEVDFKGNQHQVVTL